ncbi:cobalt-precorrin-8x methylmutase [Klebsiella pneumoniae]|uniref:Cobalt-precorrin-8x methylmutase n=1 Tax=Klebsiella pneumoniae TaxID=573 RepID=A0A3S4GXZ9_KLEPN|nr:cobalt-precorrin-8x methylmutase [Klebsiella pneumoniae]
MQYIQQPQAIEAKSFDIISEIIAETRPDYRFASPLHEAIIKRVIHTTADFDWLDILWFSPDALIALSEALNRPCTLYTDTTMALSGINKTLLARLWRRMPLLYQRPAGGARGAKPGDDPLDGGGGYCGAGARGESVRLRQCANRAVSPAGTSRDRHRRRGGGCRSGSSAPRSRKRRSARAACRPSPRSAAKGEATWRQRL